MNEILNSENNKLFLIKNLEFLSSKFNNKK